MICGGKEYRIERNAMTAGRTGGAVGSLWTGF
jgi:hypothetical protein